MTIPVAWTDAVVTAMRMVNAPSVSAAIRVKPKGGRPSGTYTIDKVEAVVIALAVEYGGLKPSEIIRALGLKPSVHTYHQIRYRHERGRQWITGQHVPADLRPEHLRTLTSEERTTRIHQALRALRER